MSHKTKTAAALSAETLCKSSVLNIVPYEMNLIKNYSKWKKCLIYHILMMTDKKDQALTKV